MYVGNVRDNYAGALPGVFYNDHGTEVDPQLAKEAGYDVPALLKERKKRERIRVATEVIEAEYRPEEAVSETVKEKNGFKVVHVGLDRHNIVDPDGNVLNKKHLTKGDALRTLEIVAASEQQPEAEAAPAPAAA
jgi:hypothetical protein